MDRVGGDVRVEVLVDPTIAVVVDQRRCARDAHQVGADARGQVAGAGLVGRAAVRAVAVARARRAVHTATLPGPVPTGSQDGDGSFEAGRAVFCDVAGLASTGDVVERRIAIAVVVGGADRSNKRATGPTREPC